MQALVLGFADDTDFAPPAAVDPGLAEMPILRATRRRASPQDADMKHFGHLGFFKDPAARYRVA